MSSDSSRSKPSWVRRLAPVAGLLVLAPFVAEYLLGNVPARSILLLPFLVPLYGAGAVLIREVARRTGRGWPAILLLGLAYGLIQPGLVEMSLFNPAFEGLDFTGLYIPALGFSPYYALAFVVGHAVWSISVPIALAEAFVPERRTTPWLGNVGLAVIVLLQLLGAWMYYSEFQKTEEFMASPLQLLGAGAVAAALIVCALTIRVRPQAAVKPAPNPWLVGLMAFIASSVFFAAPEDWFGVALKIAVMVLALGIVRRWSVRADWGPIHIVALAGGAMLTYMWGSFVVGQLRGYTEPLDLAASAGVVLAGLVILFFAARKTARAGAEPRPERR